MLELYLIQFGFFVRLKRTDIKEIITKYSIVRIISSGSLRSYYQIYMSRV